MTSPLARRAYRGLAQLVFIMGALIFVAAGTLAYWQAWVFVVLYGLVSLAITVDLVDRDPALLERRMTGGPWAEKEPAQKIIMAIATLGFFGLLVVPGLDHRFGWSQVPAAAVMIGEALTLLGWWMIFHVFRANTYTAAIVEVAPDHRVVSVGPYAVVRHPMYAGGLVMLSGVPIALGSWWGVAVMALVVPMIVWRVIEEEGFLIENLPGYDDYCDDVRWRLMPGVW